MSDDFHFIENFFFSHVCSFWVGSTNFDENKMTFSLGRLEYNAANQNPVLDYIISVEELPARLVYKILKKEYLYFFQ